MYQTKYANAYAEVYEILSYLNEQEYKKIPKELIEVFKENRNLDYEYKLNDEQDLLKQPMLKETKAILFNIFKDYLATQEQNEKINRWLAEDRKYLESKKQEKYNSTTIDKLKKECTVEELSVTLKQESIFQKIIAKIKYILKK